MLKTARLALWTAVALAVLPAGSLLAQMRDASRPFLLWSKDEAAAIKKRLDSDPVAQKQLAEMTARETAGSKARPANRTLYNLFLYSVNGDERAAATEKAELLKFIGRVPEPLTQEFQEKAKTAEWQRGMASFADRHMRDEQTLNTLRYDVLYDLLTPEERAGVEKSMRTYIKFHLDGHQPWHPDFRYGKMSWLPNMSWPRTIGTHIMAVALKDEKLIEAMFSSQGGFKYYLDDYISDGRFYNEEFAKYYSNIGSMLTYCEGLERLGLGKFGYGYTGKNGATMKSYMQMQQWLAYPYTTVPGGMGPYRLVTMGDAKGRADQLPLFGDYDLNDGILPGEKLGDRWWTQNNMNGPLPKMAPPMWLEVAHRRWPEAGFDFFLAAMRRPGENVYLPSLYFGLGPIDAAQVKPPADTTKSYLAMERGFAFLRAQEGSAYWQSPAPAVAMQFGMYYAHYAHDCFSLLGLHAFNRPIYVNAGGGDVKGHYVNEHIRSGPPTGYIARHPWKDTNRGHAGITVVNLQPRPVNSGENGLEKHRMRSQFANTVKFVAGQAEGVFPNTNLERAGFLTREYFFDVLWAKSNQPRQFDWTVIGPGHAQPDSQWSKTSELNGSMLYREFDPSHPESKQPAGYEEKYDANDLQNVHKLIAENKPWTATILQSAVNVDFAKSKLGQAWYDRGVGVRVSMLPEPGTTVFSGAAPGWNTEAGGSAIIVRRKAPATVFATLHEPFEGGMGKHKIETFERFAQNENGVAARIAAKDFSDRVLFAYGETVDAPITLRGGEEAFTFVSHGFVRQRGESVEVVGDVRAITMKVAGTPKLTVNGAAAKATVAGGVLNWSK